MFHPSFPFFMLADEQQECAVRERVTQVEFTNVSVRVKGSLQSVTKPEHLRILVQELQTGWG